MESLEKKKPSKLKRFLLVIFVTVLLFAGAAGGALYILFQGPFVHAAAAFVQDVSPNPIGKAVLSLFITPEEQKALMSIDRGTGITAGDQKLFSVHPDLG